MFIAKRINASQKAELKKEVFRNIPEFLEMASASWAKCNEHAF